MRTKLLLVLIALSFVCPIFGQSRPTKRVAILETVDKEGQVPYGIKLMIRSQLSDFITATPGYEGYERIDVSSILNEHEFQRSGLVSDNDIKKLGEMAGADYILVAEAAYLNSSHIFLSAKILNVETARVEQTATIQSSTTVDGLEQNCKVLASKLLNINTETGASRGKLTLNEGKYIGEYKNGKPHGHGIIYFFSDDKIKRKSYEGDWINGIREGNGTMIWNDGEKYVGKWKEGARNGYGTEYYSSGEIYEGNWLANKQHGKGKITFASDDSANRKYYEGEWISGIRQGTGTMVWADGEWYKGNWKNGSKHGKGESHYPNGDRFVGIYYEGKENGEGTYYWTDGDYEIANYRDGERNGYATFYWNNGQCYKRGYYENGVKEGKWEVYQFGHHSFTNTYKNGKQTHSKWHKP